MSLGVNQKRDGATVPIQWTERIATAIESIGTPDCPPRLIHAIESLVPITLSMSMIYRGRSKPTLVHDNFGEGEAKRGLANYINGSYVLNPLYVAYQNGVREGIYRIHDLAPDGYFESENYRAFKVRTTPAEEIGYLTEDWPRGMAEVCQIIRLQDDAIAEISMMHRASKGGISNDQLRNWRTVEGIVAAVYRAHWRLLAEHDKDAPADSSRDRAFDQFGTGVLTSRERDVAKLILQGHSTWSIGGHLAISTTTVKTHRKNAYRKLGIATQAELFSSFLSTLDAVPR